MTNNKTTLELIEAYASEKFGDDDGSFTLNKMDPKVKRRWVKALRSGAYPQTSGALAVRSGSPDQPDSFCCLGVLCDVGRDLGVTGKWDWSEPRNGGVMVPFARPRRKSEKTGEWNLSDTLDVPAELRKTFKMDENVESFLISLNDEGVWDQYKGGTRNVTFADIADFVEKHL